MDEFIITLAALKWGGGVLFLFLAFFLPAYVWYRLGKRRERWERRQRESAWSIKLMPDD